MTLDPESCGCPPAAALSDRPITGELAQGELATLTRALGHPVRVKILALLKERQGCICKELGDEIPLAASTISQHLKQLREAGFIRGEVDGPRICYCIELATIQRLKDLVSML